MSLVIISNKGNEHDWKAQLTRLNPDLDVQIYPNDENPEKVDFALAWNPPLGVFNKYPNLKCIASTGAGVDHIIKDPDIPEVVSITRVVDHRLTKDMSAYLVTMVMAYLRDVEIYKKQEREHKWQRYQYPVPERTRIGIMGMGELGKSAALRFLDLGFMVKGWSKSPKPHNNVQMYAGTDQLDDFLGDVNILVCLLPLTPETSGILSKKVFDKLSKGAYVVNVARGEHLNEDDLLESIESGQLSGACLDVFKNEPLPADHPFWSNEKITITPHVASITSVLNVAPQVLENYRRMKKGHLLINEVSRSRGY